MDNSDMISLTPAAAVHIEKWIQKKEGCALRVRVEKTGCSGFSYVTEIVNEINPNDIVQHIASPMFPEKTITVCIDSESLPYLKGTCIDYGKALTEAGKPDLLAGFKLVFINPNQKGACGCGESFNV